MICLADGTSIRCILLKTYGNVSLPSVHHALLPNKAFSEFSLFDVMLSYWISTFPAICYVPGGKHVHWLPHKTYIKLIIQMKQCISARCSVIYLQNNVYFLLKKINKYYTTNKAIWKQICLSLSLSLLVLSWHCATGSWYVWV